MKPLTFNNSNFYVSVLLTNKSITLLANITHEGRKASGTVI